MQVRKDLKRGCNARWRVFFPCCLKQDEQDLQDGQDEQDARGLGAEALGAKASLLWVREPEDNPRAKWIRDCSGSPSLGP